MNNDYPCWREQVILTASYCRDIPYTTDDSALCRRVGRPDREGTYDAKDSFRRRLELRARGRRRARSQQSARDRSRASPSVGRKAAPSLRAAAAVLHCSALGKADSARALRPGGPRRRQALAAT